MLASCVPPSLARMCRRMSQAAASKVSLVEFGAPRKLGGLFSASTCPAHHCSAPKVEPANTPCWCTERTACVWSVCRKHGPAHCTCRRQGNTPPRLIAEGSEAACCHRHYRPTVRRHYHFGPYRHQSRCLPRVARGVGGTGHYGLYAGNSTPPLRHPSCLHCLPIWQTQTRRT